MYVYVYECVFIQIFPAFHLLIFLFVYALERIVWSLRILVYRQHQQEPNQT